MNRNTYIIIPAYNEESRLGKVIEGVEKFCHKIIVIDDGSKDKTYEVAKQYPVTTLRHRINLGKGAAMKTGVEAAIKLDAESIIFIDADGQHNPSHLPQFLKALDSNYDIVFGKRDLTKGVPFIRLMGNKTASKIIKIFFKINREDILCGLFGFNLNIYPKISWTSSRYGVETEVVAKVGKNKLKFKEIPIETIYLDKYKGVTIFDALNIFFSIPGWLFNK